VALVVITTWVLIQSARGSRRVWSTPITQPQKLEPKDGSTSVNQRKSWYMTTSARLAPYLGPPQLLAAPQSVHHQRGSSTDLLRPIGAPRTLPDPNSLQDDPRGGYNGVVIGPLPSQGMSGPAMPQDAPPPSAFSTLDAFSSQGSVVSAQSYPYPFPAVPPSSRSTSYGPSLTGQPSLQIQPPDRSYNSSPLQDNQTSTGNLPYGPVPTQEETFRTRGNKHAQTTTALGLHPGQGGDDDASSIASRYSTKTTMSQVNPDHSGTISPPIPAPPPIPRRSSKRQPLARLNSRDVYGQHGSIQPLILRRAGRNESESPNVSTQKQ
jgi:hypothetical protein